ncbi:MAG: DUF4198 domain-containing protein [Candidatus Sphingomonas phytovorans]|nr:DUF4198 domain-containing protein [Sphingomonas sp.]WEK00657.1 MAG: DUF4198 domain-containing protein [Sphingomonas sp.]
MRKTILFALMLGFSGVVQAHEVWVERDGNGPARIYLGEPAEALPPGGDPEFAKLKAPRLLSGVDAKLVRKEGFIEAVVPAGDVRAWDDNVFDPWGPDGKKEGVIYYARAGRSEATAKMPLEIMPVTAGGTRFALVRDGKPLAGVAITIVSPDKWSKGVTTDAQGHVDVPMRERGRYLLSASIKDAGPATIGGGTVSTVHRIATTTFVVP